MKFQIVLENTNPKLATMASDDFEKLITSAVKTIKGFKLLYARSLDGVRPEVYGPPKHEPEDLLD